MKRATWIVLAAWSAWAHVVSMSSGDLTVTGARGHYELRMPLFEVSHVAAPERTLLDHVQFAGARMMSHACAADSARDAYICTADYEFPAPPDRLDVDCTLAAATVPNHVHLLRAELDGKRDQAVFDLTLTRATLRFRPPTTSEIFASESSAGFVRALGPVQILFLGALALAARTRRELAALAGMFLFAQIVAVLIVPRTGWQPAPRFVEAAIALTVAYLAVEILLLPRAGSRWMVAGVLGAFHGLYFHLFLQNAAYSPGYVLVGAAAAELMALVAFAFLLSRVTRYARIPATALLVFSMVWFVMRLRG